MSHPIETVQAMYAAFSRGDVAALLSHLSEDVRWDHWPERNAQIEALPWFVPRTGREQVLGFFQEIGKFQFHRFEVHSLMANERQVAACLTVDLTLDNGQRFADQEMHLFTFNAAGQVSEFRHFIDTAKTLAAAAG